MSFFTAWRLVIGVIGFAIVFSLFNPAATAGTAFDGSTALNGCIDLGFGNPPTSATHATGAQDCYTFAASSGDEIRVNVVTTSGNFNADLEIIRPDGNSLCDTIFSELTCHLNASGTHRVIVDGLGTGGYKIVVQRLNDPVSYVVLPFGNPPDSGYLWCRGEGLLHLLRGCRRSNTRQCDSDIRHV